MRGVDEGAPLVDVVVLVVADRGDRTGDHHAPVVEGVRATLVRRFLSAV